MGCCLSKANKITASNQEKKSNNRKLVSLKEPTESRRISSKKSNGENRERFENELGDKKVSFVLDDDHPNPNEGKRRNENPEKRLIAKNGGENSLPQNTHHPGPTRQRNDSSSEEKADEEPDESFSRNNRMPMRDNSDAEIKEEAMISKLDDTSAKLPDSIQIFKNLSSYSLSFDEVITVIPTEKGFTPEALKNLIVLSKISTRTLGIRVYSVTLESIKVEFDQEVRFGPHPSEDFWDLLESSMEKRFLFDLKTQKVYIFLDDEKAYYRIQLSSDSNQFPKKRIEIMNPSSISDWIEEIPHLHYRCFDQPRTRGVVFFFTFFKSTDDWRDPRINLDKSKIRLSGFETYVPKICPKYYKKIEDSKKPLAFVLGECRQTTSSAR